MLDRTNASGHRRKQARPRELLDAALALFVEKGFAAARAEDIAARAGVSKATLSGRLAPAAAALIDAPGVGRAATQQRIGARKLL